MRLMLKKKVWTGMKAQWANLILALIQMKCWAGTKAQWSNLMMGFSNCKAKTRETCVRISDGPNVLDHL